MAFTVAVMSSAPRMELIMAQPAAPHFMTSGNSFLRNRRFQQWEGNGRNDFRKGPRPKQDASFLVCWVKGAHAEVIGAATKGRLRLFKVMGRNTNDGIIS